MIALAEGDIATAIDSVCRSRLPGITEDLRELQVEIADDLSPARYDQHRLGVWAAWGWDLRSRMRSPSAWEGALT